MAAPRRSPAELSAGALALATAVALAVLPAERVDVAGSLVALPGVAAVVVLGVALAFRWPILIPVALVFLVGEYGAFLAIEGGDRLAPALAAAFVLTAELAYWGSEPRAVGRPGGVLVRRVLTVLALAVAAALTAAFLLGAGALVREGGVAIVAVGVGASVAALGVLAWLARTSPARPR